MDFINETGLEKIKAHEDSLLEYALEKLNAIDNLKIVGTAKNKSAIISFTIKNIHHYDLGLILDKMGVAIRTGHHCTQPILNSKLLKNSTCLKIGLINMII